MYSNETIAKVKNNMKKALFEECPEHMPLKRGNKKLGLDTVIFSMTTALNCPSAAKGLCNVRDICYALRDECFHNNCVPYYRQKSEIAWDNLSIDQISDDIAAITYNPRLRIKVEYVRFNEAGDFKGQSDVDKLIEIAKKHPKLIFYGYTHRSDLDYSMRPKNLVINGSGFMIDNNFKTVPDTTDYIEDSVCPGTCYGCDKCKIARGNHIYIKKH